MTDTLTVPCAAKPAQARMSNELRETSISSEKLLLRSDVSKISKPGQSFTHLMNKLSLGMLDYRSDSPTRMVWTNNRILFRDQPLTRLLRRTTGDQPSFQL